MTLTDNAGAGAWPAPPDAQFREQLLELIPAMRAFARSLCRDRDEADDLAQETLYRALYSWRSFRPNTNLKAWVFTILRNRFLSTRRAAGREARLDPDQAERTLAAHDDPYARFELDMVRRGLACLPDEQREAIILICAAGLSYEEAAEIAGVPIGTVKSRLSRGRASLLALVEAGGMARDDLAPSDALSSILAQATGLLAPP
ncbi:MAG TPA: sigma-70 family RNA polymerase sigma factor [Caulobacter sp.]|nr:sigma-70 family RNA polymerase sigma factor [Caulobacter sp.]